MNSMTMTRTWAPPSTVTIADAAATILSFLDTASTSLGRATANNDRAMQQAAELAAHQKLVDLDRGLYALLLQLPGVTMRPLPVAPRQIPYHAGYTYFELETRGSDMWKQLESSGGLAMHIAGDFPGLELEFWAVRG